MEYSTQEATATATVTCNISGIWVGISDDSNTRLRYIGSGYVPQGQTQTSLQIWAVKGYTSGQDRTYTVTGTVGASSATAQITVKANVPTIQLGPDVLVGGLGQVANGTVTMRAPVRGAEWLGITVTPTSSLWYYVSGDMYLQAGQQVEAFSIGAYTTSSTVSLTFTPDYGSNIGNSTPLTIIPQGGYVGAVNVGPCKHCVGQAGAPINLGMGNVWVQQRDYSLPGLGGGLELVRTWNSLFAETAPSGGIIFGHNWRSTYEERLSFPDTNTIKYWRSDGSGWAFSYNSATHIFSLTNPTDERAEIVYDSINLKYTLTFSDKTKRIFNSSGYLTALIDRNSNQTTLTYDGSSRLTFATDAAGRSLEFRYDNATMPYRVSSIKDATGTIATYTLDNDRKLTRVTYADNSYVSFDYDSSSFMLLAVRDSDGKLLESHTYDSDHRGLTSARALGADAISVSYPPITQISGQVQVQDSMARSTTYTFDRYAGRRVVTGVSGPGCSSCGGRGGQSIAYDTYGNVTSMTDALSRVTNYTYDTQGNMLTKSVHLDAQTTLTWTYTYNTFGQVLTATDPPGNVTTNTYDTKGNLLSTTTPPPAQGQQGLTTSFEYDSKGQLTRVTDPRSNQTTLTYTAAGLIESINDAQNKATTFAYDTRGNRTSSTDALNNATTYTYNNMNRLTQITQPGSLTTTFTYDTRGRRTSVTDANSKTTSYSYSDADHLLSVTDAEGQMTAYGYDTENHLTAITDALDRVTGFTYDTEGRVTQVTFPSELTESYTYDAMGNLLTKTDRKNQTITYTYDNLDRLTRKQYPDSSGVDYTYDNLSRLTEGSDATGTYAFAYDNLGRLTGTTTDYSFLSARTLTTGYTYDAASNRASFTDPESGVTSYTYDTLNRLTGLTDFNSHAFGFGYDSLGRRTSLTRANGVNTGYTYDNLSRLLSVLHQTGSITRDGATYTYDNVGNRLSKTFVQQADPDPVSVVASYSYDNIYQLTQTLLDSSLSESFSYDDVGNRTASLGLSPYLYNDSNHLTSTPAAGYSYDNNGNTTSKTDGSGTTTYTWDYENRLVSASVPGTGMVTFAYDPFGRRIYKSSASATTIYAYDGDNIIEELDSSGGVVARYSQGLGIDEPLVMYRGSTTSYYHADGLGSITALTDSSGTVAASYVYDSFGNLSSSTGTLTNNSRYTAREFDSETGLYYYRARYYDSAPGRFISEDPIRWDSADANFYRFVANSPPNATDPTGQILISELGGGANAGINLTNYDAAIGYLTQDEGCRRMIWKLQRSPRVFRVRIEPGAVTRYDPETRTIFWNPYGAAQCQSGPTITPALGLCHEFAHAAGWGPRARQLFNTADTQYDNREERRVITTIENPAARKLGEGIRRTHSGSIFQVPTPLSR